MLATDVIDHKNEVEIRLEVPGVAKEDLSVQIRDGLVTVSGTKRMSSSRQDGGVVIRERAFGSFTRTIPLSADVDIQKAEAVYTDGVLTLTVPKSSDSSARNVAVG
ncbi:MAG: Hsp20/alpha crystallin family protein [Pseudomonadaceae bacterium]|nr:Hsp20/alpha crystallin family protein [Pseudomonadaceae bacterium]